MHPLSPDTFATFGDLLKYLRRREQLTQLELSIAVGYSEAQISRLEKNQRLPDVATLKALFVPALHLEHEPELAARLLALAEAARLEDAPSPGIAPYRGLLYFDETDAALFFGREGLTAQLVARVTELAGDQGGDDTLRFLAVVGASGSGKSSLVRAGLVTALKQTGWTACVFTPTAEPQHALAAQLRSLPPGHAAGHTLILVDQFEETFTLCRDDAARVAFIDDLLALAGPGANLPTVVVIALRADFYAPCAQYPLLRQAVAAQQEYIGQMTPAELRRAIEEPAKRGGWELEPGLVELLLHDVGAQGGGEPEPGALPLLSHALLATWEGRRGRTLTLAAYRASGGVQSAIARTAENVYTDHLNHSQQALVRDLFLRLTELGEGTEDTRRRAALTELAHQPADALQLRTVLDLLAEARLITLNADSAEVAHEALIREWSRLRAWLTEDREGLRLHRHLTESAYEWERLGRDPGALYRGARLAQAREWAAANPNRLNEAEHIFLQASIAQEDWEALEREAQRQRELEAAQKLAQEQAERAQEQALAAQQLRRRAVVLAGALLLTVLLAGAALFLGREANANAASAEAARRSATVRELSAAAISELDIDPERSLLLALQAVHTSKQGGNSVLMEAEDALHRSLAASHVLATLNAHNNAVWTVALSRDGTRLATISDDGDVKVWDVATRQLLTTLQTQLPGNWIGPGVAFTPDGAHLLTVGPDNSALVWDVAAGTVVQTLSGHTEPVTAVAISPDGSLLATASDDKTVKLWAAATGKEVRTLTGHAGPQLMPAFSVDGKRLFAGSVADGMVIAWDVASGRELFRFSGQEKVPGVYGIALSPDSKSIATGEYDTTVRLWDAATGAPRLTLYGHSSIVVGLAFSPGGATLASASEDGTIILWDAATGKRLDTLAGHKGGVLTVTYSPDGRRLYSGSRDNTVRSWDVSPGSGQDLFNLVGHTDRVNTITYSPDRTRLATWSWDGTARVWDAANGQELLVIAHEPTSGGGGVNFSPDGTRLALSSGNQAIVVDAENGSVLLTLPAYDNPAADAVFSPDGARLAVGSQWGDVHIYAAATGKEALQFDTTTWLKQVAYSPDGSQIAVAGEDGASLWNAGTGQRLFLLATEGQGVLISRVAFSPDGKWLASFGNDSVARVWDTTTGAEVFRLIGHTATGFGLDFSPDGTKLATSSVDRTIKVWTLPQPGEPVEQPLTLYGHTGAVYSVAFSPDGTHLASAGRNPIARVYVLPVDQAVALAQARLTRSLTTEECQKFLHVKTCPGADAAPPATVLPPP